MEIADWRRQIDDLDRKLVDLLNQRAAAAREIGRLKQAANFAIYEPAREREIYANICRVNHGPLPDSKLIQVFERIVDVMRNFQIKS
ncbi:MAG: chorismate mutase [Terriglobales bacterium]|jgi:chorismate mutase